MYEDKLKKKCFFKIVYLFENFRGFMKMSLRIIILAVTVAACFAGIDIFCYEKPFYQFNLEVTIVKLKRKHN